MAGTDIKITVDDRRVTTALDHLARQGADLRRAALKNIGQQLVKSTRARFATETSSDGTAWAALNPEYKKGKRGTKILQEAGMRGGLLGTIVYQVTGDRLQVGTNKVYGAIHQFSGKIVPKTGKALVFRMGGKVIIARSVTIPARPFLGISAADKVTIAEVVQDHIDEVWNRD